MSARKPKGSLHPPRTGLTKTQPVFNNSSGIFSRRVFSGIGRLKSQVSSLNSAELNPADRVRGHGSHGTIQRQPGDRGLIQARFSYLFFVRLPCFLASVRINTRASHGYFTTTVPVIFG
jgi:hypothetical protein